MMSQLLTRKILENETPVSDFIPYSHHITDTIISTKSGEYLSVWRIGGRSHQSASEQDVFLWTRDLNNLLRGMATENVSLWSHVVRRRVFEYPDSEFNNSFCRTLDAKYRKSFTGYNLMVNDLYLTVVFRPVSDKVLSFFAQRERESQEQKKQRQARSIKELEDINRMLAASLTPYNADLLGIYDKKGHAYSSALEFLAFLVNGEHRAMPVLRERFSDYIAFNRPFFSRHGEIGEIRTANALRRFGMLEIKEYDDTTEPGQLNALLESDYEFIMTQSFAALSKYAAKGFLERHEKHMNDAKDVAQQQVDQIKDALNGLISGDFVMGEHHATIMVFGDNANQVRDYLAEASSTLLEVSIISKVCDLALETAYRAQMPANWAYRPRPMPITSNNFLSFSPFHNFMSGKPIGNPWGAAVTILKTVSGTPVYYNFHVSPLEKDSYFTA